MQKEHRHGFHFGFLTRFLRYLSLGKDRGIGTEDLGKNSSFLRPMSEVLIPEKNHDTNAFEIQSGIRSDSLNASHFRDYFIPLPGCFSPFPHGTIRY